VQAGTQGEALRRVADRLCAEFTDPEAAELPGLSSALGAEGGMTRMPDPDDEALVARLRQVLAAIASTLSAGAENPPVRAIETALDGAEFVIRGELVDGNIERVLRLMPSFVFLVALSVTDQDRALELSRRTAELIAEIGP
jgi:hypothetical protein